MGSPQASTSGGITVSTSKDYASAGVASQALGGQVTVGTSLSLQDADRVAHQVTSGAVSIVFTLSLIHI